MKHPKLIFCAGAFVALFISCQSPYYQKSYAFADQVWEYDDPKTFSFEINDTVQSYDMALKLDHTDEFPYQNLYLKTTTVFPSDSIKDQLLSLEIANEAGFWFGQCSGPNCSIAIPIQSNVHFSETGEYRLTLEQYTRTQELKGVKKIALLLTEQAR